MNPLRLSARNYRAFETLDLEFPSGCIAIVGENGAGKSSIVNLIDICLFGTRALGEYLSETATDSELEMTLDFEHGGNLYRVRRSFSGRGRGKTTLDFEHEIPDDVTADLDDHGEPTGDGIQVEPYWSPLTREDQKQTQALIEDTIGLSRETFRASAFLAQGDGAAFTEAQPRDRKRILCEVLGLDVWDRLVERARSEVTTIRDTTSRLSIQLEEADRELATKAEVDTRKTQLEADVVQAQEDLDEAEAAHKTSQGDLEKFRETTAKLAAAREVLASRQRELGAGEKRNREIMVLVEGADALPKLKAESETLAGKRESIERDLAAAREGEKARDEHRRLVAERDRLSAEVDAISEKERVTRTKIHTVALEAEFAVCDRCGQTLEHEAAARAVESYRAEADALHAQLDALVVKSQELDPAIIDLSFKGAAGPNAAKQAELEAALRVSIAAGQKLATIDEKMKRVEELQAERDELLGMLSGMSAAVDASERDVATLEADVPADDLEEKVARAASTLIEARNVHTGIRSRLDVVKAEIDRLAGIEQRSADNRRAMAEHEAELHLLQLEERVYGRDGIPVFILENTAIPALEVEAQRILSLLGGKTAAGRIELRTQRALKSGDGLKESLDIVLYTADGGERAYEHWSGGEKTRMNLALRLALANVLANRRGAESQVFVLDEPGDLDLAGKQALVELLREVHGRGIDKVLLVSHDSDLREAFDQVIEIEVTPDGGSRVVGAVGVEAVAAA